MREVVFASLLLIIVSSLCLTTEAQESITGAWRGAIETPGGRLRIVINISRQSADTLYSATMDSPDQGAFGIKVDRFSVTGDTIKVCIDKLRLTYSGVLRRDTTDILEGVFLQGFTAMPLTLNRGTAESQSSGRPQDPIKPYPYAEEQVQFSNRTDSVILRGTMTIPHELSSGHQRIPAVVLVSGSGPQDRDEQIMGHRPFLVLADFLTRHGIAVLRYDDRGVGASSGEFSTATTFDFARDAAAAVDYLSIRREIDPAKIGIIGHSEGGIIAPIVASSLVGRDVAFVVLLAGPGVSGDSLLVMQNRKIGKASGMTHTQLDAAEKTNRTLYQMVKNGESPEALARYLHQSVTGITQEQAQQMTSSLCSKWFLEFLRLDPSQYLQQTKCPILALGGDRDLQVPARENLEAIKQAASSGGNRSVDTLTMPGLNHLFQECRSGLPSEYSSISQTISPAVLEYIIQWINVKTGR